MPRKYKSFYPPDQAARQLSGGNYVPAHLKTDPVEERFKLPIATVARCDHASTICASRECVDSWRKDYHIFFPRTAGGRGLWNATHPGEDMPTS